MVDASEPAKAAAPRFPRLEAAGPWTEMAGAVIMSVAALTTSWAGYQSALWDGDQAANYSKAESLRTEASTRATRAGQFLGADVLLFTSWLGAYANEDARLQAFYVENFRPEFKAAHAAWLAMRPQQNPSAPRTPFTMPNYDLRSADEARALERRANALFLEGQRANRISDDFVKVTVILAAALFFGGIGQVFRTLPVRLALLGVAAVNLIWGVIVMLGLPVN